MNGGDARRDEEQLPDLDVIGIDDLRARRTAKWSTHGEDVLAAWVAEMDFPTAAPVLATLADAVQREQLGYPLVDERTGVPEAAARWLAHRHGWHVDPSRIHLVPDVLSGVALAIEHGTRPGSPVVVPTPVYPPLRRVPGLVGRDVVEVPHVAGPHGPGLDLDAIDGALAAGAGSVVLCNPQNPLGRVYRHDELAALAEVVARHDARVLADEIHAPLTYPSGPAHVPYATVSPAAADQVVTLTSATKAWNLPGLRCAFAITTSDRDQATWDDFTLETHGATTLGIEATITALDRCRPWLDHVLAHLDVQRTWAADALREAIPGLEVSVPEGTYLQWIDCRALDLPGDPAAWFLAEAGVALNEGSAFGPPGAGHVRLNLATSRPILERIVDAMAEAVARRHG